jgi:hypothetical protein
MIVPLNSKDKMNITLRTTSFFLFMLSVLCMSDLFAQEFYYLSNTGTNSAYTLVTARAGTKILDKPSNNLLSAEQTLPFPFNFAGMDVTRYKASDNGYITFDPTATTSYSIPSDLPSPVGPSNAIYAFWKDWELKSAPNTAFPVGIWASTLGTAPNRIHVIQWFGISPFGKAIATNADVAAFAICLYEGTPGRFDIVFNGAYGASSITGTVGAENTDGSKGLHVGSGTTFSYPFSTATSELSLPVIQFFWGTQPSIDMSVRSCTMPTNIRKATDYTVGGIVANFGKTPVTSFELNYSINGGASKTMPVTGVNIAPAGGTYTYTHSTRINESSSGSFNTLKIWCTNINGSSADEAPSNDEYITKYVAINNTSAQRTVFLEEATGAWCQHCPDAHQYMTNIKNTEGDRVVLAVHHNADGMTNPESDILNAQYAAGYPNGFINRTLFPGQTTVGTSRSIWAASVTAEKAVYSPASVTVKNVSYDSTSRNITATVEATFSDFYSGELRLGCMIKEEEIRGGTTVTNGYPDYNQIIASTYTSNPAHVYYGKKSPMVGYYHRHVVINIPSGAWGKANSVPGENKPNDKVTATFSYTLPPALSFDIPATAEFPPTGLIVGRNKPEDIWIVGFLAKYDIASPTKREILNVAETRMLTGATSVEIPAAAGTLTIYPNAANNECEVGFYVPASTKSVTLKVYNTVGQVVAETVLDQATTGYNNIHLNTAALPNGIYTVLVNSASFSGNARLMVAHQ